MITSKFLTKNLSVRNLPVCRTLPVCCSKVYVLVKGFKWRILVYKNFICRLHKMIKKYNKFHKIPFSAFKDSSHWFYIIRSRHRVTPFISILSLIVTTHSWISYQFRSEKELSFRVRWFCLKRTPYMTDAFHIMKSLLKQNYRKKKEKNVRIFLRSSILSISFLYSNVLYISQVGSQQKMAYFYPKYQTTR